MSKDRPNRTLREYGKASKTGVMLVKKRNPTLSASQWKRRALGLYGTVIVICEVGPEDQVREDDKVTEELDIPRSAQVVVHSVLGMACVCVETSKHPLIFRPVDESQGHLLQEWTQAIQAAVLPPKPGSLDPLNELRALMKRKDLTTSEAQRAQALMRGRTPALSVRSSRLHHGGADSSCETRSPAEHTSANSLPSSSSDGCSMLKSWGDGDSLFGATPYPNVPEKRPEVESTCFDASSSPSHNTIHGCLSLLASLPVNSSAVDASTVVQLSSGSKSPDIQYLKSEDTDAVRRGAVLSTVFNGDGDYCGYIALNGACYDAAGLRIGYLNDSERTAGSPRGEYLGCVSDMECGEATIDTSQGAPLAKLNFERALLITLAGSTIASFGTSGHVVADLGHSICRFDALSSHDLPTMALYLSFIAPGLLRDAARRTHSHLTKTPQHVPYPPGASRDKLPSTSAILQSAVGDTYKNPVDAAMECGVRCRGLDLDHASQTSMLEQTPDHSAGVLNCSHVQDLSVEGELTPTQDDTAVSADMASWEPHLQKPPPETKGDAQEKMRELRDDRSIPSAGPSIPLSGTLRGDLVSSRLQVPADSALTSNSCAALNGDGEGSTGDSPLSNLSLEGGRGHPLDDSKSTSKCTTLQPWDKLTTYRVALADFIPDPSAEWQVGIRRGEFCKLVEDHGDGWSTVTLHGSNKSGVLPSGFIERTRNFSSSEACPRTNSFSTTVSFPEVPRVASSRESSQMCNVAHAFQAEDPTWQASLGLGEHVVLVRNYDDGWSEVIKSDGTRGFVPSGFLQLL